MTTPDNPAYENKPSNWNSAHLVTINAVGSEISGAFGNAGGVSFGIAGGFITAAAPAGAPSPINFSAGTTSSNIGSVVFADSNGISFGLNGSTITGTVRTNYQSAGAYLTTARASTDAVGLATAQTNVTWTVNSAGLSLNAGGYAGTGFTTTTIAGAVVAGTHDTAGLKIAVPAYLTTAQAPGAYLTTARASNDAIGLNTAQTNVTWTVNSSGLSFNAGGYAGTTTGFAGANISGSMTHNTAGLNLSLSVAGAGGAASASIYATSNTTGGQSSSAFALSALTINAYGILSAGMSNGSLQLSTPDPVVFTQLSVGNSTMGNTAGDTGVFTGRVVFVGSNNITLSGSSNGASQTISIIGGAGGGGGVGLNTAQTNVTWTVNTSGISFNAGGYAGTGFTSTTTAGTAVVGTHNTAGLSLGVPAYLTTARASTDAIGLATAQTNVTWTVNSAGLSFNAGGYAGTASGFTGANISATITHNTAGLSLSMSVAAPGAAAEANPVNLLGANTAGNTTATGSTLGFSGVNLTLSGTNASQIVFSAPATSSLSATGFLSISTNGSTISIGAPIPAFSADVSSTFSTLSFQNSNNVSFSNNAGAIRITHNLAGTGTAISGRASITLNSTGLSFDGNGIAGTGFTTGSTTGLWSATNSSNGLSMVMPYRTKMLFPEFGEMTAVTAPGNATMSFRFIGLQGYVTATRADIMVGRSFSSSLGAGTQTLQESRYMVIYTKNAASFSSLSSGSTQTTWTMASNTAGQTQLTQAAIRLVSIPININMPPGEYFIGINLITAGTAVSLTQSIYGGNDMQTASNFAEMGSTTNVTTGQIWGGMGLYSAASTGMPAALSISGILQTGANLSAANVAVLFRNA
jgi:hypothetical protein